MYLRMLDDGLYDEYTQSLDKLLNDLRGICLGYHLPFSDVLPAHLQDLSDKEKAQQLAQQLSFALAYVSNCTQQQINSAYHWFYEIFCFLYDHCPESDHVCSSFFKLYELDLETRQAIFHEWQEEALFVYSDPITPVSVSTLQQAVLHIMVANKQSKKVVTPLLKIKVFLNSTVLTDSTNHS